MATAVNQTLLTQNSDGAVWLVSGNGLPLYPGQTLILSRKDAYYQGGLSRLNLPIEVGSAVYVQVDSAAIGSTYDAIWENHEIEGETYNNIFSGLAE